MRLGRLWFAMVACLVVFCGVASANGLDPDIQLGGDPNVPLIQILTYPNFSFNIAFPGCTSNCTATYNFQNDTGHDINLLVINFAGGGLSCGSGPLPGSPLADCEVLDNGFSLEFYGGSIAPASCTDVYDDWSWGWGWGCDWSGGGTFSATFSGFTPNSNGTLGFTATANTPEPGSLGLMFSGLGALIAAYKKLGSRRAL